MIAFLPDILERHVEEAQFLWESRRDALHSPAATPAEVRRLDERIEAHVEGIVQVGPGALAVLEPALRADAASAFVSGFAMLRMGQEPVRRRVFEALFSSSSPAASGIALALCHAPPGDSTARLRKVLGAAPEPGSASAAAAEVLAVHSPRDLRPQNVEPLVRHGDAAVRGSAWRAVRATGVAVSPAMFRHAIADDDDPSVRSVALDAAAWSRQPWLLAHLRAVASKPTPERLDALAVFGVLGASTDLALVQRVAATATLGPGRFEVVAAYGHPETVAGLINAMRGKDVASAAAAGAAFARITGLDVASERRAVVPPPDGHVPDDFEKEFLDEVALPDAEVAFAQWQEIKPRFAAGTRWCRGVNVSAGVTDAAMASLDMKSRRECRIRGRFEGTWRGSYFELERFPYPRASTP